MPSSRPTSLRSSNAWPPGADEILMQARVSSKGWDRIASTYFPGKSGTACRKRHERLMKSKDLEDWDEERLERLSSKYLELRKEMWTVLGNALGERWEVVEFKCMDKGIKNLTAVDRRAKKRDAPSKADEQRPGTGEGDSGIFMDGADSDQEKSGAADESYSQMFPPYPAQERRASSRSFGCGPSIQSLLK